MKRKPLLSRGALARIFEDAAEASQRLDYEETIRILERGQRLDPANTKILLDLGLVHGMRYDYPAAERCFERALRVGAQKNETLVAAGNHSHHFGNFEMARRYYERALEQNAVPAEALVKLAELCERKHHLEEAAQLVDRALHLDGNCGSALIARARMDRQGGRLEEAERRLRSLLARAEGDTWTRARAWYELGALLDRQGCYDEAMAAFLQAKGLLRPGCVQATAALHEMQARVKEMEESMTEEVLRRWHEFGPELQPPRGLALLCGHPRSGTTLLEQVLDSHPGVVSAEETLILHEEAYVGFSNSFAKGEKILSALDSAPVSRVRQSRENYFRFTEAFLGETVGDRLLVDKNPSLTIMIPPIIRLFPETKFLVALRDPRDVCLSCFMQSLPVNPISSAYLTLEGTMADYALTMGFCRAILPRMQNPVIEVRYEEMVNGLEPVARRVLDFLGVPWDPRVLNFDEHARTKTVRSPTYVEVTKPIFKGAVGRWRNYQKYFEPHLETLAPFIKAFGYE
jgi:Tfp pilus assembly protein PilF